VDNLETGGANQPDYVGGRGGTQVMTNANDVKGEIKGSGQMLMDRFFCRTFLGSGGEGKIGNQLKDSRGGELGTYKLPGTIGVKECLGRNSGELKKDITSSCERVPQGA